MTSHGTRTIAPVTVVVLVAFLLTACGQRGAPTLSVISNTSVPSSADNGATTSLAPSSSTTPMAATPTTRDPATSAGPTVTSPSVTTVPPGPEIAQVRAAYSSFLQDITGLDDTLNAGWISYLQQVATPRMIKAAEAQAISIFGAHEHTVGILKDDHQVVKITSTSTASVFDCLDELHWYLVEDASGQPEPAINRGYFVGVTDLVSENGHWLVDIWQPAQGMCHF